MLLAMAGRRRLVRHPHRIGLPLLGLPLPSTIYTRKERDLAATAEDCAAGELISHRGTAGQQPRDPVGATRNKPAVGPTSKGPGTELLRRVQDKTSSSSASIHARSLLVSPLSIIL